MAPPDNLAPTSLVLSVAVATIAILLGLGQWWEHRRRRGIRLSDADRRHFFGQDLRRAVGVLLMLILSLGIYVGSRIPPTLSDFPLDAGFKQALRAVAGSWVAIWVNGLANPQFLALWLMVFVLLVILLALALWDWGQTRRYAHRQRHALAGERLEILRATLRQAEADRNGFPSDPGPDGA